MKKTLRPITEFTGKEISFQQKAEIQDRILKVLGKHFFRHFYWKREHLVYELLNHVREGGDDDGSGWYAIFEKDNLTDGHCPADYDLFVIFREDNRDIIVHFGFLYDRNKLLAFDVLNESGQLIKVRVDSDDVDEICKALDSFYRNFIH